MLSRSATDSWGHWCSSSRFQWESTLRFIPKWCEVPRVLMHLLSLILQRHGSWLYNLFIATIVISARVCPSLLKYTATKDSSLFLCVMLKRWSLILWYSSCPVSAMYCWPHLLQVFKRIILEHLQDAVKFILNFQPVIWLLKSSVALYLGHILQPAVPQGLFPGNSWLVTVKSFQEIP